MRSSVVIISNPAARGSSRKKLADACSLIKAAGREVSMIETLGPGDATRIAAAACAERPSLVIAAGGDGTVNEVLNGMIGSETPLAFFPLGTTNVLARELGLPTTVPEIVARILDAEPRPVSLGRIELPRSGMSRHFCLMAGIGFDAASVYGMHKDVKKISGETAYILSGVRNVVYYSPEELTVSINGEERTCFSLIVGKASRYGGDFRVTPGASLLSPSLHACFFEGHRRTDLLRYACGIVRGKHLGYRDVRVIVARELSVQGTAHVQIDGDYFGRIPARLSVAENALRLVW
ncbi:MAG: diacylglycerol kinase family lipid kinase [Thermodesulfovibrionales bacterium]